MIKGHLTDDPRLQPLKGAILRHFGYWGKQLGLGDQIFIAMTCCDIHFDIIFVFQNHLL